MEVKTREETELQVTLSRLRCCPVLCQCHEQWSAKQRRKIFLWEEDQAWEAVGDYRTRRAASNLDSVRANWKTSRGRHREREREREKGEREWEWKYEREGARGVHPTGNEAEIFFIDNVGKKFIFLARICVTEFRAEFRGKKKFWAPVKVGNIDCENRGNCPEVYENGWEISFLWEMTKQGYQKISSGKREFSRSYRLKKGHSEISFFA